MTYTHEPRFIREIPPGDEKERAVCHTCGFIDYVNPKIVAGAVVSDEQGRILMCKRAIEPRAGFWTIPAGFMEERESVSEGASREVWEEARARIEIDALIAIYTIPRISQVQMFFRARLTDPKIEAGPESLQVGLFHWQDIPMNDLAFPSVRWALEDWRAGLDQATPIPAQRTQGDSFAPIDGVI